MTARELEEYSALRATIRERGTARNWTVLAGFVSWASLTAVTAAFSELPVATLLPLLILAVAFEIVFSLHIAVERIGRYLQVFAEGGDEGADHGWEHYAMLYGREFGASGCDALYSPYFAIATVFNFVPALLAVPVPLEWGFIGTLHLLFLVRIGLARRAASHQRAIDLGRFQQLKADSSLPRRRDRDQ